MGIVQPVYEILAEITLKLKKKKRDLRIPSKVLTEVITRF